MASDALMPSPAELREIIERLRGWAAQHMEVVALGTEDQRFIPTATTTVLREAATLIERLAASQAETRRLALEEAAKVVEARGPATQDMTSTFICAALDDAAAAIRALIDQPSTEGVKE